MCVLLTGQFSAFGTGVFVDREELADNGNLRAVEDLAGEGDHADHEVGLDEGEVDVAWVSQALRARGQFFSCISRIADGLAGGHAANGENAVDRALRGEVLAKAGVEPGCFPGSGIGGHLGWAELPEAAYLVGRDSLTDKPFVNGATAGAEVRRSLWDRHPVILHIPGPLRALLRLGAPHWATG